MADEFSLLKNVFGVEKPSEADPELLAIEEAIVGNTFEAKPTSFTNHLGGEQAFDQVAFDQARLRMPKPGNDPELQCCPGEGGAVYFQLGHVRVLLGWTKCVEQEDDLLPEVHDRYMAIAPSSYVLRLKGFLPCSLGLDTMRSVLDRALGTPPAEPETSFIIGGRFDGCRAKAGDPFIRDRDFVYHSRLFVTPAGVQLRCYVREGLDMCQAMLRLLQLLATSSRASSPPPASA